MKRYARTAAFNHFGTQGEKKLFNILPFYGFDRILKYFSQDFAMFVVHSVSINDTKI
jgi:hypothetical protein